MILLFKLAQYKKSGFGRSDFNFDIFFQACIQYVSDAGFADVVEMADDVFAKVKLDPVQTARLSNIVGFDIRSPKKPSQPSESTSKISNAETES